MNGADTHRTQERGVACAPEGLASGGRAFRTGRRLGSPAHPEGHLGRLRTLGGAAETRAARRGAALGPGKLGKRGRRTLPPQDRRRQGTRLGGAGSEVAGPGGELAPPALRVWEESCGKFNFPET